MQKLVIDKEVRRLVEPTKRQEGCGLFALVDGALHQPALAKTKSFARPHAIVPIGGVVARSDLSKLPFLVELTEPSSRLIEALAAWAFDHSAVTWLESRLPIASLAEALALRLEAELPQNMSVLLRFFDARVLPVLHDALNPEQYRPFFAFVTNWWYVSRQGELQALPLRRELIDAHCVFTPPLRLTASQEQQLMDAAEPDAVMQILQRHDAQALAQVAPGEQYHFIKTAIERARTWSARRRATWRSFACWRLRMGWRSMKFRPGRWHCPVFAQVT